MKALEECALYIDNYNLMKRYIFASLFIVLLMASACRRKCALCEVTTDNGIYLYVDVCRKDYDSKEEWEAMIKYHESGEMVCTTHR